MLCGKIPAPNRHRNSSLAALAFCFLLTSCGYVGDPLPPLANVPAAVTDLAAIQRGSKIIVQFTVPTRTTEQQPIPPPLTLDLRAGTADQFNADEWAAAAHQYPAPPLNGPVARYEIPAADFTGKEVILGVRSATGHKQSMWSNWVTVPVVPAPPIPASLSATSVAQGVHLTWQGSAPAYRVFRKSGDGAYDLLANPTAAEWTDASAETGKEYKYLVQAVVPAGNGKQAESELSAELAVTPRDVVPPAAPQNLQGSTAPASIELTWDRNVESDLAGYRVYRALADGAFEKLADLAAIPSYSDRKAESGKTYRYQVTAFDQAGNESSRSSTVTVSMP